MTVGPWKSIRLERYEQRIEDLRISTIVSEALDTNIKATISFSSKTVAGTVDVNIKSLEGHTVLYQKGVLKDGKCEVCFKAKKGELELWWPVGYGRQPLYTVEVIARDEVSSYIHFLKNKSSDSFYSKI
jgi:beta-mannosidase